MSEIRIAGVADAGYFLDVPSFRNGVHRMQVSQGFIDLYKFQNAAGAVDEACRKAFPPDGGEVI